MEFTAYIDIYCERTQPGLWSEPLNAATNLAFVLAAWLCWRHYGQKGAPFDKSGALLMSLVGLIGIGSGLFHTVATRWAMLADVIPIAIFIHAFLFFALQRFFGLNWIVSVAGVVGFLGISGILDVALPHEVLNGSGGYIPPFGALVAMGAAMLARNHPYSDHMLIAAAVFAASLMFRTVDMMACEAMPIGTHFLWHTLNGVALYMVGKAYLRSYVLKRNTGGITGEASL